jgi:hypothetical protein
MTKQDQDEQTKIQVKPYSLRELAEMYEVTPKVLQKWLIPAEKEIGPRMGRFYTPRQVKTIFQKIGMPEVFDFK